MSVQGYSFTVMFLPILLRAEKAHFLQLLHWVKTEQFGSEGQY